MKMYCLYDNVRKKYFRDVYDGREDFTVKPYELCADKAKIVSKMKRISRKPYWNLCFRGPVPKFDIHEFEVKI